MPNASAELGSGNRNLALGGGTAQDSRAAYDFSQQVGHLLRKALQAHFSIFQRMCIDPQLTGPQFAVLCAVRDLGSASLTDIGRVVVMDPATTRGIVERLNTRKLLSFSRDTADRRRVIVSLEPAGADLIARMVPVARDISEATVQNLNAAERVALNFLLEKISDRK